MLTKEEYSVACGKMQEIWQKEMKQLEATSVQSLLNGDSKSIEYGKKQAERYLIVKDVVDQCINVLSAHIKWENVNKPEPLKPVKEIRNA